MAKDPAVLFYTSDFLSGTFTMTDSEKGRYITLLCLQHQKGKLTEKDIEKIQDMPEVLEKFVQLEDGFYYNLRMKEEAEKRKSYSESRRKNRLKKSHDEDKINTSKSYDNHMKNISLSYVKHMENENENINDNITLSEARADKLLDSLLEITKYKQAIKDINELGGIEVIFDTLGFDSSQRSNWINHIRQKELIFNQN